MRTKPQTSDKPEHTLPYDIEEEPLVLSKKLMDLLFHQETSDVPLLYIFYYYTAKWQGTNAPKCTTGFAAKGLHWSQARVRTAKKILLSLKLIRDKVQRDPKSRSVIGHYIHLRLSPFTTKTHPHDFPQGGITHSVGFVETSTIREIDKYSKRDKENTIPPALLRFSKNFHKEQQTNWPNYIKDVSDTTIQKGAKVIHALMRIDEYDFKEQIQPALQWGSHDDFWSRQLLSLGQLRKKSKNGLMKFANLLISYDKAQGKKPQSSSAQRHKPGIDISNQGGHQ